MLHSDKKNTPVIIMIKFVVFAVIFVAINYLLCNELEPLTHKSHAMWERYFAKSEIDTIFVGTSVAEMIDERLINEDTSLNSVNMATPSQYLGTSMEAVTLAAGQNPIKTVVLLMGFDTLERPEDLTSTISMEKSLYYGAPKKTAYPQRFMRNLKYSFEPRNIGTTDSVNKWLSWPVNSSRSFEQINTNHEEEKYNPMVNLFMTDNPPDISAKPYNRVARQTGNELFGPGKADTSAINNITAIDISDDSLDLLEQLIDYCNMNDIRFIAVIAPHRSDYASGFGEDYQALDSFLSDFVIDRGGQYINLDNDPEVDSILTDDYFIDMEHVNAEGIQVASHILAGYLR